MQEAGELAATTAKLLNVSEFTSISDATSALVSSLQAFTEDGQDVGQRANEIVDILNNIGNNYPVATNELAQGLETSAAALVAANNSIEQQVALLSAGNATMQDISTVASGLKIVAARLRGTTTDIDDDADSAITNVSKLQAKIKALTKEANGGEGIDIINEQGGYKETYEILLEISKIFDKMDDVSRASLLELIAGKNRSSVVAAILQNGDILENAYKDAIDSVGSADKELDTYMNSIQGKIDQFTNSVQTMWNNFIGSDTIKLVVDLGTKLVKLVDQIGLLRSALILLFGAIVPLKIFLKATKGMSFAERLGKIITTLRNFSSIDISGSIINLIKTLGLADTAFAKYVLSVMTATTVQATATGVTSVFGKAVIALKTIVVDAAVKIYAALGPVGVVLGVVALAVAGLAIAYNKWGPTHKNFVKKLEEETNALKEIQSNLESLNSELKTTKDRIEELENKGPLTVTEQEELDKLKAQNDELERQIKLEEAREERAKNRQANAAADAYKTDNDFKVKTIDQSGNVRTDGTGDIVLGNEFDIKLKAVENAKDKLDSAQIALQDAIDSGMDTESKEFKKLEKNEESAQNAYVDAQSKWDDFYKKKQEEYDGLEWFDGDNLTESQKKVNEILSSMENYGDRAEILFGSAGSKESALNRIFGEKGSDAAKEFKEKFNTKEIKDAYKEIMSEVKQNNIDLSKTVYGNIDMNNRQVLEWTKENLEKNKDAIESWGETIDSMGDYSTVFGGSDEFDGIEIAFSPMLQTDGGPVFLDKDTVYQYIYGLLDKAKENGEEPTLDVLLQLDQEGLEVDGKQIKNLLADVGDTAIETGEAMHYAGQFGAVADAEKSLNAVSGSLEDVTKTVEDMINASPELKTQLDSIGLSAEDVARYFLYAGEAAQQVDDKIKVVATDISTLTSAYDSYASALQMANEVAFDGQVISDDSYDSLRKYLGDVTVGEEDFSDAVDVTNGKVIKNTKLLKDLIAQKKKEQKATASAAKAQSQLQYTKVVRQLQQAVKTMALDYKAYGYVTQATYQNIAALREQIKTIQNAIREYTLLELKLSDATTAYTEFENAKNRDAELTYGDSWIEGIQALNDGFATGKVGTETFKAAVDLIVPKEAYEGLDNYQDRLIAIHDYVDKNPLFADWFTVDEDGNFGIEFKNMAAFVQDMQNMDVFTGDDITGFNLASGVNSIDDIVAKTKEWNNGVGVTKETIVAMLTELSKYDARWGNLLEELTMTDIDKSFKKTTDALDAAIAKQEQFFKDGKDPYGADFDEYDKIQQEINNCSAALDKVQQGVIKHTNAWMDANNQVDEAKNNLAQLQKELDQLKESGASDNEIQIKTEQVENAKKVLSEALQEKSSLEEPSQLDIQLTFDDVQSQIDAWKEKNVSLDVEVVPKLEKDENGVWKIPAEVEADLSDSDKQKMQEYVNLINSEDSLASLLGLVDTDSAVNELSQIKDVVSDIDKRLGGKGAQGGSEEKTTSDGTKSVTLHGNATSKENIEKSEKKKKDAESDKTKDSSVGFDQDAIDQKIAAANAVLKEWGDKIGQFISSITDPIGKFFTETLPTKWNEFWTSVGNKFNEIGEWAQGLGESIGTFFSEKIESIKTWAQSVGDAIGTFFTETLPQKWDEFWTYIGTKINGIKEWAQQLGQNIDTFFTDTLPQKWDESWVAVGDFIKSIPYNVSFIIHTVEHFFSETLPEKWNEFWEAVGDKVNEQISDLKEVGKAVKEFFTKTLPEKWHEYWDAVKQKVSEQIDDLKEIGEAIKNFFAVTLPEKWNEFWEAAGNKISEQIANLKEIWETIKAFFTVTLPEKLHELWGAVSTFITETVPAALETIKDKVIEFFTVTIPGAWNSFWDSVSSYISTNITPALRDIWNKVVEFFTVTIPEKWNELWKAVGDFITETVPTALEDVKEGITNFFTKTIPEKINGLWDDVSSWISAKAESFWSFLKGEWIRGKEDAEKGTYDPKGEKSSGYTKVTGNANAKGNAHAQDKPGLKTNEHNTVVGELGRELVCDVDKGVYYTVGDNGTEMVDLPKNAIIYNHKQTEELLKNGQTSRGQLIGGLSFAKGNSHAYYSDGYRHGLFGGYLSDDSVFKDTSRQWVDYNKNWVQDYANASNGIIDSLSDAADSISDSADDFEDTINWIEVLFTRIDDMLSEHEGYLATIIDSTGGLNEKDSIYSAMFDKMFYKANKSLEAANYYKNLAEKEMDGLDENTKSRIRMGTIDIQEFKASGDEATTKALEERVDKINKAIEYYDQISQYTQQYYSTLEEIADKAVERQGEVSTAYENEIGLVEHLNNTLEARNNLEATKEGFATEAYYKAQIDASQKQLEMYQQERKALQDVLDQEVALGHVKIGSQQWFDMQQAIYDADDAIIDMESSIEDLQNSINDLYWDRFDELINRFGYLEDEISNVVQLLSHDPDGLVMKELKDLTTNNWATGSGLASLGLYAQQMEEAQYVANQYAEQIKELKKQYASGRYNETEYLSKLNELISAQYENIEKYHDAKDAIVELNKTRVDAIRDGIEKEIDAYDELIQKKKDLLNKEQDLHDFQDEISEKEKNVSDIRKQLAAMAGDDTAATTAKRKQLEADLIDAQKALEDSYYSHSMNARQDALDQEFSDFEEEKNKEIEKWEDWLENTEQVVSDTLDYVKSNTNEVFNTLKDLGNEYNLTMSDSLITPWQNGSTAIDSYSENFGIAVSDFTAKLDDIVLHWNDVQTAAEEAAKAQSKALQAQYNKTSSGVPSTVNNNGNSNTNNSSNSSKPASSSNSNKSNSSQNQSRTYTVKKGDTLWDIAKSLLGSATRWNEIYNLNKSIIKDPHWIYPGQKLKIPAYAKGTLGTKQDAWSLIDELGDELVAHSQNGRLAYLSKGTGVVPADLTEKLIDMALDPTSIFDDVKTNVKVPNVETKDFNFDLSFDSLLHVDNATKDSVPELKKMIRNEFNDMMSQVNNRLKRV